MIDQLKSRNRRFCGRVPSLAYLKYSCDSKNAISCHRYLYFLHEEYRRSLRYDSFSSEWETFWNGVQIKINCVCVRNEDNIYVLMCEYGTSCPGCVCVHPSGVYSPCGKRHLSYLVKYTPESNSWEYISSCDMGLRFEICAWPKTILFIFLVVQKKRVTNTVINTQP